MSYKNVVALFWVLYWEFKMIHEVVLLGSEVDSAYSVNYLYLSYLFIYVVGSGCRHTNQC